MNYKDGNRFVRMSNKMFNTYIETLKTCNSRHHRLGYKASGCVKNSNTDYYSNVLYLEKVSPNLPLIPFLTFRGNFMLMKLQS